jgi:hypothetical protein
MKISKVILFSALFALILVSCKKADTNDKKNINVKKVDYSGCFTTKSVSLKSGTNEIKDSLYFDFSNSVLNLHIDKVYGCCNTLKDSFVIKTNSIDIYLQDSSDKGPICNCICVYKYNYQIENYAEKNITFNVYTKIFLDTEYKLWKTTNFVGGLD